MRLSHLLSLSLSLLLSAAARTGAQLAPADDFFHRGAQSYLSNNIPAAQALVDTGLKLYPSDEHLKKLDELLKQQDQQKNQDQQQQNQKEQPNRKSEEQKKPDEPKQQEDPQKGDPKKDEPQKSEPEKKDGGKPEDRKGDGQPQALQPMTPEEAKRLLDAQKNGEQMLQLKPPEKPQDRRPPAKDW